MIPQSWKRNGWTMGHIATAAVLGLFAMLLTGHAWLDMAALPWDDPEASHVFLAPLIAVWLFYVRRQRLRYCVPRNHWIGPAIVAAGWLISSYGYYNGREAMYHGGTVMVVVGGVLTGLGSDILT